jgi:hypothetical protein
MTMLESLATPPLGRELVALPCQANVATCRLLFRIWFAKGSMKALSEKVSVSDWTGVAAQERCAEAEWGGLRCAISPGDGFRDGRATSAKRRITAGNRNRSSH